MVGKKNYEECLRGKRGDRKEGAIYRESCFIKFCLSTKLLLLKLQHEK